MKNALEKQALRSIMFDGKLPTMTVAGNRAFLFSFYTNHSVCGYVCGLDDDYRSAVKTAQIRKTKDGKRYFMADKIKFDADGVEPVRIPREVVERELSAIFALRGTFVEMKNDGQDVGCSIENQDFYIENMTKYLDESSKASEIQKDVVLADTRSKAQDEGFCIEYCNLIGLNYQNHFWYGGHVATVKRGGITLYIKAVGDINVCLVDKDNNEIACCKDENNAGEFYNIMKSHFDDEGLVALLCGSVDSKGRSLVEGSGNWFEWEAFDEIKQEYVGPDASDNVFDSDRLLECLSPESLSAVFETIEECDE